MDGVLDCLLMLNWRSRVICDQIEIDAYEKNNSPDKNNDIPDYSDGKDQDPNYNDDKNENLDYNDIIDQDSDDTIIEPNNEADVSAGKYF